MHTGMRKLPSLPLVLLTLACSTGQQFAHTPTAAAQGAPVIDTLAPSYVPAGFGSLKQDDISLKVTPSTGLQVNAVPLEENLIRLLSPDSYRALSELKKSQEGNLKVIRERYRLPSYSIWYVKFFATEQGETRFSPQEFIINNTGRDFRPLEMIPLSPGFGEYRLKQREVQSALFVFDGQIDINQPTKATMEGTQSLTDWGRVLQIIERERSMVKSRASAAPKKPSL